MSLAGLDPREQKIAKATTFPPEFSKKVDSKKVNLDVIKQYALNHWRHQVREPLTNPLIPDGWQAG
jgi:hypothetical protein